MTSLNYHESALLLVQICLTELDGKPDLRSQLATIRLRAAAEALGGAVDMQEYERKVLGVS